MNSNESGIHPTGSLVLVLMDKVSSKMGLLDMTDDAIHAQQLAQIRGTVIECGPKGSDLPSPGSRVICRRYAGELVTGNDGLFRYRVMNDKDIWATFDSPPPAPDAVVIESTDRLS
jgi:hypothetical protein